MLCNRMKSSQCLFLLVALLGAVLAGCGGDEPAPAPPPPPPPPPPAFVPVDVPIVLGTSGETLTLQTTESGGFTRDGEPFASGTTVEAAGNTYRLVLDDDAWTATFVPPPPVMVPLGASGETLTLEITESGGFTSNGEAFASGSTAEAAGNTYRLELQDGAWTATFVPPPPVMVLLGTSGETVTLEITESGGFTRNGEAFASGTTAEAAGNTYRLVLTDGVWAAEYVVPRPWATALGRSGDAVLITRREDGLFEAGDAIFSNGGTVIATNGSLYRLTLNEDTNLWNVEYLPPEPTAVLLGMSGETVLVERLEGGGYSVDSQRVVDGSTIESASGSTYRLSMQDGAWTATFLPPPPVVVPLGDSGQTVTLQVREDGQFEKDGQLYPSGSTQTVGGLTYRLEFQNGMWSAVAEARQITVTLGMSGQSVTILEHRDGEFTNTDGEPYLTGSTETVGDRTYRVVFQDGRWKAEFVKPRIEVQLGNSGRAMTLLIQENGTFTRQDGTPVLPNTVVQDGGDSYRLSLRDGRWTATFEPPAAVVIQLGASGESVTVVAREGGTYVRQDDGTPVRHNDILTAGGNRYRLVFEDGEWAARYQAEEVRVIGGDDTIILFRLEDNSYLFGNQPVEDGDIIEVGGNSYELTFLRGSREWLASRTSGPTARSVQVAVGTQTITLTRTSTGTYEYNGDPVSTGSQITVGENRYTLTQASDGTWSARAVSDTTTTDTGGVGGPTTTDTVNTFTDGRFDDDLDLTAEPVVNAYGVRLSTRGEQPGDADDRGTKIVPQRSGASHVEFPVYELMQGGLVTQERTYVDAAKAKLQEIVDIIRLNKPLYERDARDPDDHIADVGTATSPGLWRQAEMAVGKIFGLTDFDAAEMDGILGGDPWKGLTLDPEEVDTVIEALEDTIAVLSDVSRFGREYEEQITAIDDSVTDRNLDAADFFEGLMSRIRFGSTTGTRFGAYVVKLQDTDLAASDAARGGWTKGVFAYTPSDAPSAREIPDRGEATFRGSTVAVSDVDPANTKKGATLYAGKIELVASFARKNVKGTITELKDESGRTWEELSDEGRDKAVDSILLPAASLSSTETGFFETASGGATATAVFEDSLTANKDDDDAVFRVQLIDDAGEALGIWDAFDLEGAFGATRTGSVAKPTLPREVDRGGGAVGSTIYYTFDGTAGSGSGGPITADSEQSKFSLTRAQLGLAEDPVVTDAEITANFEDLNVQSIPTSRRGTTFASVLRSTVATARSGLTDENASTRLGDATDPVDDYLGFAAENITGTTRADLLPELNKLYAALGSASSFAREQESGGVFATQTYTSDQIRQLLAERRWDFKSRFSKNRYTRFGVWSQIAPVEADNNLGTTPTDPPHTGSFAYSPLNPVVAADISSLDFVADYEGRTLAVHHDTGDLYEGQIRLVVSWGTSPTVKSTITDLRGVSGSRSYFKHGTQDVRYIFFEGITVEAAGTLAGTVTMKVRYRDSSRDVSVTGTPTMAGIFVKDAIFTDEPVGVLGTWAIPTGITDIDAFSASFGAELKP